MYDILFMCQHCRVHLSADENDVGISLPCPQCEKQISVPNGDVLFDCPACGKSLLASADSRRQRFHCPSCESEIQVPLRGKRVPVSEKKEVVQAPRAAPASPAPIQPRAPTPRPTSEDKIEQDGFMVTWGDYLAQAGLTKNEKPTDGEDDGRTKSSVP